MLSRIIPAARSATTSVARWQAVSVRSMGGYAPAHWKSEKDLHLENKTHMNCQPVPEGPWQEYYNKRNAKYNMYLASSVVFLFASAFILVNSGAVYLHDGPPLKKSS